MTEKALGEFLCPSVTFNGDTVLLLKYLRSAFIKHVGSPVNSRVAHGDLWHNEDSSDEWEELRF